MPIPTFKTDAEAAAYYREQWEALTREINKKRLEYVDNHMGDCYHLCQYLTVKYGAPFRGPMTEKIPTETSSGKKDDTDVH